LNEFKIFVKRFKPRFILLSETRTTEDMPDQILDIEGYYLKRYDSYSKHTGGVAI
jgi:hypothetical protein